MNDNGNAQQQEFFTVEEVAANLRVTPSLIYREIRYGRLQAIRIGGKLLRIPRSSLVAYIAQCAAEMAMGHYN